MNVIFFASADFTIPVLDELMLHHTVVGVVTSPDAPIGRKQVLTETRVATHAKNLDLEVFKPDKLKNNPELMEDLKNLHADLCVLFAYGKIIPTSLLELTRYGILNIHPSLLPAYRGPSPFVTAILNGDSKTGVTIMLLDSEMDHGPILAQQQVIIDPNETSEQLGIKLVAVAGPLLSQTIEQYTKDQITPKPQNHDQATYTKRFTKEDGKIDWNKNAESIYNQWRALGSWPGLWCSWGNDVLKITACRQGIGSSSENNGSVLPGGMIACGDGTLLQIEKLQRPGKKGTTIKDFLNGNKNFIGSILK